MYNTTISLSDTELEILKLIKQGLTSSEIASVRNCATRTVEKHRSNIIRKLKLPTAQNALLLYLLENPDLQTDT